MNVHENIPNLLDLSNFKIQVSYLCKERNYAPWVQATEALYSYILRPIKPRNGDKDHKEREEVWEKVKKWVVNLVMPYFKETGGFGFVGKLTEEEKHLKVHMIDFACAKLDLEPCLKSVQKQVAEHHAGKKKIDSYLLDFSRKFGIRPILWNIPPSIDALCEKMLNGMQDEFTAEEGLDCLEKCWDRLAKMPRRETVLSKLVSKVEQQEEAEKLRKWWRSIQLGRPEGNLSPRVLEEHKWAARIFKNVEARAKTREDCRPMLYEMIKQVFK